LNDNELSIFLKNIYKSRGDEVPNEYDRTVGSYIECFISDNLYDSLLESGTIRLFESEKNNLISMEEIIFKPNEIS
jgi:hypothetical protein